MNTKQEHLHSKAAVRNPNFRAADFEVSSMSTWTDRQWFFPGIQGSVIQICWDFELHDGSSSLDKRHEVILESFKEVWWGMLSRHSWWGRPLKPASSGQFSVGMRDLYRWMVFKKISHLGSFDESCQQEYVRELPRILENRTKYYAVPLDVEDSDFLFLDSLPNVDDGWLEHSGTSDEPDSIGGGVREQAAVDPDEDDELDGPSEFSENAHGREASLGGDVVDGDLDTSSPLRWRGQKRGLSYHMVSHRVNVIYYCFSQRQLLAERHLPFFDEPPFAGKDSTVIVTRLAKYVVNRIPPLPDEVVLPILRNVMQWIDTKGKDVVALQRIYFERQFSPAHNDEKLQRDFVDCGLEEFVFSQDLYQSTPWRESLGGEFFENHEYGQVWLDTRQQLRMLIFRARDAIALAFSYLAGVRASELCSVICDSERTADGIPSCISKRFTKCGTLELYFIRGTLSKGVDMPRDEDWLIGCCPSGSKEIPILVKAAVLLCTIFEPWRTYSGRQELFLTFSQPRSLPQRPDGVAQMTSSVLDKGIKQFIYHEVDLSHLPNTNLRGEELWRYRESKGLCIRFHQGRKTFAAYVLETRSSLLPAVQLHFKHVSDAMTESAYFPAVYRLRHEAEAFRTAESVRVFSEFLGGRPMFGAMAAVIERWFDNAGYLDMGVAEQEVALYHLVRAHNLSIFFNDHGNCFIRANPLASRCRGATGSAGWASLNPDLSVRSPSLCSGCGCFGLDPTHLPFWETRLGKALEALNNCSPTSLGEKRVLISRRDQAAQVIRLIERGQHEVE